MLKHFEAFYILFFIRVMQFERCDKKKILVIFLRTLYLENSTSDMFYKAVFILNSVLFASLRWDNRTRNAISIVPILISVA